MSVSLLRVSVTKHGIVVLLYSHYSSGITFLLVLEYLNGTVRTSKKVAYQDMMSVLQDQ